MDRQLIETFAAGAELPGKAIQGLTAKELDWKPTDKSLGAWTIRQLVVHLMESHMIAADRMRRIIAEDNPMLIGYDQNKFLQHLHPEKLDIAMVCEAFRLNQALMAEVLRHTPDAAFARAGMHNERGRLTLEQMLTGYIDHLDDHLEYLHAKRKAMGKPL
jgi:hypothetical protein